ncbi:MAG: M14 metallopeptidase family protein [Bacteroidota bacterium]
MKYFRLSLYLLFLCNNTVFGQVKTPDEFLGYALGSQFTPHQKVVDYYKYVAGLHDKDIKLISYGKTYEGRELLVAIVSSKQNIDNLEQIRKANVNISKAIKSEAKPGKQPAILWLSYNVHGNEASSSETSMKTLYSLAEQKEDNVKDWLKNVVVILDPCLNPDGRERYVTYFSEVSGRQPNPDPMAREHFEPWPNGRPNHYYFDLNRDWAWQTQIETQQRLKLYNEWMPEVHVDFHEQNYNEPYYFAPAAEPIHVDITPWQRAFQVTVGKNNAKYFDDNGWQYFTKERFDLLYPSYGDTYPLYNGAIGMTYEQGGIGAGLSVVTIDGDTLTLKDRIDHHYTTGMATVETVSKNANQLVSEFKLYFEKAVATPPGNFKTYVVKAQNISRIKKLAALLDRNGIEYAYGSDKNLRGYSYETKKTESFKVDRNDMVVNLSQPKAVLANVLFEPQTSITDSNTYDITAWALPYAYGLKAYATKESFKGSNRFLEEKNDKPESISKPYAWILPWNSVQDAQTLIALQRYNIKVRIAEEGFTAGGRVYASGSLLVYRTENERSIKNLSAKITAIQKELDVKLFPVATGYVDKGKDFGSSVYTPLVAPKVAVVAGAGISSQGVGEIWHFFEQELKYPLTVLGVQSLASLNINKVNVLILPDGNYGDAINEKLESWINSGGKVILIEDAISSVIGKKPFNIKVKEASKEETKKSSSKKYADRHQDDQSDAIPGAIFKVTLDASHPLAAGLGDFYYALKTDDKIYETLPADASAGILKANSHVAGIAGKSVLKKLDNGMLFGIQNSGRGTIIYLASDVLFRSFWESGKQILVNSLFLVN